MAEFNIGRIRFRWTGDWQFSSTYVKDDIVLYEGKAYVCLIGHESDPNNIYVDINALDNDGDPAPRWELMFDGYRWKQDWIADTYYSLGDIIKWKGYVYQCIIPHTSNSQIRLGPPGNITNWRLIATTYNWLNTWTPTVAPDPQVPGDIGVPSSYDLGDVVIYNGTTYICIEKHTAADSYEDGLELDGDKWTEVTRSDNWRTDWQVNTRYVRDDVVKYGGIVYRCVTPHTSAATTSLGLEDSLSSWEIVVEGQEYKNTWQDSFRYKKNDIVKYGGALWKANVGHTSTTTLREDQANWDIYIPGLEYEGAWESTVEYNQGDLVTYGGYSYVALTNNTNSVPSINGLLQDTGNWELVTQGYRHLGEWIPTTNYRTGDVVRNSGYLYVALTDNINQYPDADVNTWEILVTGRQFRNLWIDNTEYFLGDTVTYAGTLYICIQRHLGTESDTRPDLDIENTNDNYWRVLLQGTPGNVMAEVGDLRTHDGSEHVRFAVGSAGNALKVSAQTNLEWANFEDVPNVFFVSVDGVDSTANGTTLQAPFRTVKFACEYIYNNLGINRINVQKYNNDSGIIFDALSTALLQNFSQTLSATAPNLDAAFEVINPRTGNPYGDIDGNGNIGLFDALDIGQGVFSTAALTEAQALAFNELIDYLNSRADDFVGETTGTISDYTPGTVPIVFASYPNTTVFIKTGIYEETLPIKVPRNVALVGDELRGTVIQPAAGYEQANMFLVNNGSGIRNMTLQGLSGTLGEVNSFFTRRPSAGAFVSLDPGTGPNDESVWITTKSCYVQNVTTFGTACVGMKIDGSLHNGGNRSVVANDFTQVLDDGIGYWATDGGRSELVSVFTYFCHIGYLAEHGGILRATNGNNSYGTYGSVAEGVSAEEIPVTANVNNQSKEAQIEIVHTDGNELVALGFNNLGQHYSTVTSTVSGAGLSGDLAFEEFRPFGISDIRILGPADSSIPGGLNYQYLLNNAQTGSTGTITLAAADETGTAEKYIGQRVVVVAGTGIGQYGVITGYDPVSKVAIVSKEYNDTNGWESLYPGNPIVSSLDTTSRYTIEPRVDIADPGWELTNASISWPANFILSGIHDMQYTNGVYIAINGDGDSAISTDGTTFIASNTNLSGTTDPVGGFYTSVTNGIYAYFLSVYDSNVYRYDTDADSWTTINLPNHNNLWTHLDVDPSTGLLVAIWGNMNGWVSFNADGSGQTTNTFGIAGGAASAGLAYGGGKWLAVHGDGDIAYSSDGVNWTEVTNALPTASWTHVAYGNNRWVAIGDVLGSAMAVYSFDGLTWYNNDRHLDTIPDGSLDRVIYGNGQFIAFPVSGDTKTVGRSKDGWSWKWFDLDSTAFTIPGTNGVTRMLNGTLWTIASGSSTVRNITTGSNAVARAVVENSRINRVLMYDPGGGYIENPIIDFYDNESTIDASFTANVNSAVLTQPRFVNKGTGYTSATVTITGGDGYADIYQTGKTLVLNNVTRIPGPGANVEINGITDVTYRLTKVQSSSGTGPYDLTITISPSIGENESPDHQTSVVIREEYSQIRLTGHDFLDIGTGNVNSTRYPQLYLEGQDSLNAAQPFNEVVESDGGRVFYTSTDQDGNFRVGELFSVEQATGAVTVNADIFELSGLSELSLGGVQVGGSAVVVREFSKDGTFVANSNNIVPTQSAIIKYLESRISSGGSDALTNTLIAGQVKVSGHNITTTSGLELIISTKVEHNDGIDGDYLALQLFGI